MLAGILFLINPICEITMNKVTIKYCTGCRWLIRSTWMAQELLTTFESDIDELTLVPGVDGIFQVQVNEQLVWDRKTEGGFPQITELKQRVRDIIVPERSLGHVDKVQNSNI